MPTANHTRIPLFEELHGQRIVLRPYREEDAQAFFEAVTESREHLRPWVSFADPLKDVEKCRDLIIECMELWLQREALVTGIWERATNRFLGSCELNARNWESRFFELGYWLRVSATGCGYTTEAVQLMTDYAFTQLSATRVEIRCDERNLRSVALPRRLGFVQEGRLRNDKIAPDGFLRTTLVFALIPADRSELSEK